MVRLNHTYSLLNLQANFSKLCVLVKFTANYAKFAQFTPNIPHHLLIHCVSNTCLGRKILSNSSKLCKFRAVRPHSLRTTRNSHHLLTDHIFCFRHLPRQRKLRNSSKLCKFRAVCPHVLRITRNSHKLLTYYYVPDT